MNFRNSTSCSSDGTGPEAPNWPPPPVYAKELHFPKTRVLRLKTPPLRLNLLNVLADFPEVPRLRIQK